MLNRMLKTAVPALAALLLASCGGGERHGVTISITDAPIDLASSVNVSFAQIKLSGPNVAPTVLNISPAASIDLFQLQGGLTQLMVPSIQAQPGHYDTLSLTLLADQTSGQTSITLPDGVHILYIPPGTPTRVNIPVDFDYASGGDLFLTVDFDLRKSVVLATGNYMLRPALRIVDTLQVGTLEGSVDNTVSIGSLAISDPTCGPAVYIYSGSGVTPVDINATSAVQPLATAALTLDATSGKYDYSEGFLQAGDYTVALVCAAKDDPTTADTLGFSAAKDATVTANTTTTVDFP